MPCYRYLKIIEVEITNVGKPIGKCSRTFYGLKSLSLLSTEMGRRELEGDLDSMS